MPSCDWSLVLADDWSPAAGCGWLQMPSCGWLPTPSCDWSLLLGCDWSAEGAASVNGSCWPACQLMGTTVTDLVSAAAFCTSDRPDEKLPFRVNPSERVSKADLHSDASRRLLAGWASPKKELRIRATF